MYNMIQKLGDVILHPFGLAWFISDEDHFAWNLPPGYRWFAYEVWEDLGPALLVWLGPVRMIFDRGE